MENCRFATVHFNSPCFLDNGSCSGHMVCTKHREIAFWQSTGWYCWEGAQEADSKEERVLDKYNIASVYKILATIAKSLQKTQENQSRLQSRFEKIEQVLDLDEEITTPALKISYTVPSKFDTTDPVDQSNTWKQSEFDWAKEDIEHHGRKRKK